MNDEEIKSLIYKFGERAVKEFQGEQPEGLTPKRTDNYLSMISGYSSMLEEEIGKLEMVKASEWLGFRNEAKSNVDAEKMWDATNNGLRYIQLTRLLRAVDKICAACRQRLRRFENEARNKY